MPSELGIGKIAIRRDLARRKASRDITKDKVRNLGTQDGFGRKLDGLFHTAIPS